eukprot:3019090-Pleurochrysis_carterae.AAC.1
MLRHADKKGKERHQACELKEGRAFQMKTGACKCRAAAVSAKAHLCAAVCIADEMMKACDYVYVCAPLGAGRGHRPVGRDDRRLLQIDGLGGVPGVRRAAAHAA